MKRTLSRWVTGLGRPKHPRYDALYTYGELKVEGRAKLEHMT